MRWPETNSARSHQCEPMSANAREAPPTLVVHPPVCVVRAQEPVLEIGAVQQVERPGPPAADALARLRTVGSTGRRTARWPAGRCRPRLGQPLRSGGVDRQRLLADHVLPRRQGCLGERQVEVVRRADVDDVDVQVLDQLFGRVEGPPRPELLGRGGRGLPRRGGHSYELGACQPYGARMNLPDEPGACDRGLEAPSGWDRKPNLVHLSSKRWHDFVQTMLYFSLNGDEVVGGLLVADQRGRSAAADPRGGRRHPSGPRAGDGARPLDRRAASRHADRRGARPRHGRQRLDRRPPARRTGLQPRRRGRPGRRPGRDRTLGLRSAISSGRRSRSGRPTSTSRRDRSAPSTGSRSASRSCSTRWAGPRATCAGSGSECRGRSSSTAADPSTRRSCPAGTTSRSRSGSTAATARRSSSTTTSTSWPAASTACTGARPSTF